MAFPLRGDDITACTHRIALQRGAPPGYLASASSPELERRREAADETRSRYIAALQAAYPDSVLAPTVETTRQALRDGVALILTPRLPDDVEGARRASVSFLVRTGRVDGTARYAPGLVKNAEIVEPSATKSLRCTSFAHLLASDDDVVPGVTLRSNVSVTRAGLSLTQATVVLATLGHDDPAGRIALVDRQGHVWWADVTSDHFPRINVATYTPLYERRLDVVRRHDAWRAGDGPFPTAPYYHRECAACPFHDSCYQALDAHDDVSLVRYTNEHQQAVLHRAGVVTRHDLARLNVDLTRRPRSGTAAENAPVEVALAKEIESLDELIYRARAYVRGSLLRCVTPEKMHCPTADVEVDIDMESYGDATYLWGAYVRYPHGSSGDVAPGYHAFVEWGDLTDEAEAALFRRFWTWLWALREATMARGATFAAYCFWAQAENGAMNRGVALGDDSSDIAAELDDFRRSTPAQWVDLHAQAKEQLQSEGPMGLKVLARAAGFEWRDENPSGEASMLWYEEARRAGQDTAAWRQRLLDYNEDDCRATVHLRDWLNTDARHLPHRDDPLPVD